MISIYTCQRMTGRMMDEMVVEAQMLVRMGAERDFKVLNPVLEEKVPMVHEILPMTLQHTLEEYWKRDKEMIREADITLDFHTQNMSDGSVNEVGYSRWCLWKPTVRVWSGKGGLISRVEDDLVVGSLELAFDIIQERWGTYDKLAKWRTEMLEKSYPKWVAYQRSLQTRYGMKEVI